MCEEDIIASLTAMLVLRDQRARNQLQKMMLPEIPTILVAMTATYET